MTRARQAREPALAEGACLPLQMQLLGDTCCRARHGLLQQARRRMAFRLPGTWVEQEFDVAAWKLDKAFACEWLDTSRVLVATKCNQLMELDVQSGQQRSIELPPEPPQRSHPTVDSGWGFCGIHCITINPSRDLVATGGKNPTDAVVLRLPDYRPVATLTGHLDWVFGAAWVSDRHLVTGSRDGALALWDVPEPSAGSASSMPSGGGSGGEGEGQPAVVSKCYEDKRDMKRKFKGRVRDVRYDRDLDRLAALGTEGCIKLFDLEHDMRATRVVTLEHTKELVCIAQRADLIAAGSCGHISAFDPRQRSPEVRVVPSPDGAQGVRSVVLHEQLLSFGTGQGKLAFVDVRTWQPLDLGSGGSAAACPEGEAPCSQQHLVGFGNGATKGRSYLECGAGWLQQDDLYWDHFVGMEVRNACYAHAWDPTGSALFACGGPLAFGLKGCYMALWR